MRKTVLLALVIAATTFTAKAQQYYSKPFVTQLEEGVKALKGNEPKDTVMTAKKMAQMFALAKGIQENITNQIFNESVLPSQIDTFMVSPGENQYKGAGLGIVKNYNHKDHKQQMSLEVSTDTTQFYSIRYYMGNADNITKGNTALTIKPFKANDKYEGIIYRAQGYSFIWVILDNAYVKITTMDVKMGDKSYNNYTGDQYKKLLKKLDLDKINKATSLK